MKKISIKTVDGSRFDIPPRKEDLEITLRPGIPELYFIKLQAGDKTRYINVSHIVCITEMEDQETP